MRDDCDFEKIREREKKSEELPGLRMASGEWRVGVQFTNYYLRFRISECPCCRHHSITRVPRQKAAEYSSAAVLQSVPLTNQGMNSTRFARLDSAREGFDPTRLTRSLSHQITRDSLREPRDQCRTHYCGRETEENDQEPVPTRNWTSLPIFGWRRETCRVTKILYRVIDLIRWRNSRMTVRHGAPFHLHHWGIVSSLRVQSDRKLCIDCSALGLNRQ